MAEAATAAVPAAPSAPSAPAGPAAAPGLGTPVPDSGTQVDAAADARAPRLAKPLKPIPSIPGVFPDEDPFPPPPSKAAGSSDGHPPANAPTRGPDGRFVSPSSDTTAVGEHASDAGDAAPPAPKTPVAKFRVGDIEFDSEEHAAQNFKSLRGQFRPLQGLAKEVGGIDKIVPHLRSAAESARAWKAEADRLKAELDARGASPAGDVPDTASPATDDADAGIDWSLYAEIKRLANDAGEPWQAEKWLIEQTQKAADARYQKLLDERLAPVADAERAQALAAQTETLFENLAGYTLADGSPAFPELNDEAAAYEIGRIWANLGFNPEDALTPRGATAAVALYRMSKAPRSQARPVTTPLPTVPTPPPPAPTDASSAAALDGGRPSNLGLPGAAPSTEAQRILSGLRQANSGSRAYLGFDA